ncbi:MAG: hypothetical protein KZQ88_14880 [Candidatus Thiodiazotropha sp. (ex Dulcina madagascariensis)]|nr:hypothetical protein [Candidatus Thiodiazotropha sp. (ex Dulcina madagascariensis)]
MTDLIELKKGEIYFLVGFFDSELSIPSIETYIYEGVDEDDSNSHLFINAIGHLNKGNESNKNGGEYISFPKDKINGILDKVHLLVWLKEEHSPKIAGKTYEYKTI